jgi:hypothetical protein
MTLLPPIDRTPEDHLSPDEIAILAEGHATAEEAARAREHLARCRSCMSAYADTVRYRAAWLVMPQAFDGETPSLPAPARPRGVRNRIATIAAVGAGVAAIITVIATLPHRDPPMSRSIVAALERASSDGLVLPGGEAGAVASRSRYRSGLPGGAEDEGEVERLRRAYEGPGADARDVYPLAAGLVATGQLDRAHDYIEEGRARSPRDHRFAILAGVVAFQNGDPAGAERALRDALVLAPGDPVATLDLGLVEAVLHGRAAADPYLREVIGSAPRSPLAARARRALGQAPAR